MKRIVLAFVCMSVGLLSANPKITLIEEKDMPMRGLPYDLAVYAGHLNRDRNYAAVYDVTSKPIIRILPVDREQATCSDQEVCQLELPYESRATVFAWSNNGKYLAAGFEHGTVVDYWDVETCEQKGTLMHGGDRRNSLAWSRNGQYLASSGTRTVDIWEITGNGADELVYSLHLPSSHSGFAHTIESTAWSPDGKYLAVGASNHTATVWNTADWSVAFEITHKDRVSSVAWSPDSQFLACGSWDRTVSIWDVATQKMKAEIEIDSENIVTDVAWEINHTLIVGTGSTTGTLRYYDVSKLYGDGSGTWEWMHDKDSVS